MNANTKFFEVLFIDPSTVPAARIESFGLA